MKFLVYSSMNADTVVSNFGEPEYSYYFVLREFVPFLSTLGKVIQISDPLNEVDAIYEQATQAGEDCLFLSFSAPHNTCLGLKCPTIPVFAWEFSTMPNEAWWPERPQDNWQWCLEQCAGAIVHSQQTADLVRELMGKDFPVIDIPAPLWDRMRAIVANASSNCNAILTIEKGLLLDTHNPHFIHMLPTSSEVIMHVQEDKKIIPINTDIGYRRSPASIRQATKSLFAAWYHQVLSKKLPQSMRQKFDHWAYKADPWQPMQHQLQLTGVVFTSLFNPLDGRKNWPDMLMAFCETFKEEPNATLVFKLGHRDHERALRDLMLALAKLPPFKCRVILIHGFLSNDSYLGLLEQTHFALNASYGEGQCLPLMEYLSYGKPAISPCHSALADYIDEDIAFIVDCWDDVTSWPHDPRTAYRALRKQISWPSLCKAFRNAYDCYVGDPQRYQAMSESAIKRMHGHCSYEFAQNQMSKFIRKITVEAPVELPAWLRLPSLHKWLRYKHDMSFSDSRDVGLIDSVDAGWYQNESNELFRGFSVGADDTVLDIGCGAGGATLFAARRGAEVIYTDITPENIEQLNRRVAETPARASKGFVSDCLPLPLENETATRIISMEMLEHVEDPAAIMTELFRVGKSGALYLISVPDARSELLQKSFASPEYFQKPNHINIFSADQFSELVTNSGLEIIKTEYCGFFWTIWMCIHWVCSKASKTPVTEESFARVQPPYYPILDEWASIWDRLLSLPESEPMRRALDQALPKSQIILARKP